MQVVNIQWIIKGGIWVQTLRESYVWEYRNSTGSRFADLFLHLPISPHFTSITYEHAREEEYDRNKGFRHLPEKMTLRQFP